MYRKPVPYGFHYYYVDFITEQVTQLSNEVENIVSSDSCIILSYIYKLENGRYRIYPIANVETYKYDVLHPAYELDMDELIPLAFEASANYIKLKKLTEANQRILSLQEYEEEHNNNQQY